MQQTNQYITNDSVLQARAIKSYSAVASFLALLTRRENRHLIDAHVGKDGEGRYTLIDLGRSVPSIADHKGLYLQFQPIPMGGGGEVINNGDGTFTIVIHISIRNKELSAEQWNQEFSVGIHTDFNTKKTYYAQNFKRYLRQKYYLDKKFVPTFNKGKDEKDPDVLKAFYNDPQEAETIIMQARQDILARLQYSKSYDRLDKELGITSANSFIKKVFNKYFHPDFKKYLSISNRTKLFKDLYDLYLDVEEQYNMTKSHKISAAELQEMIRKEISSLMESEKGAPEWKSIDKHEKTDKEVQPPKEVDGGDTAPKSLKDLMGLGGDEVLVKPEEMTPAPDKGDEKMQLEPSAKTPMSEGANAFLMCDLQEDDSFRF